MNCLNVIKIALCEFICISVFEKYYSFEKVCHYVIQQSKHTHLYLGNSEMDYVVIQGVISHYVESQMSFCKEKKLLWYNWISPIFILGCSLDDQMHYPRLKCLLDSNCFDRDRLCQFIKILHESIHIFILGTQTSQLIFYKTLE